MIELSSYRLDPAGPWRRDPPRPPALRNADYAARFDWLTLLYDVYRVEGCVVLQGPPFRNLLDPLRTSLRQHWRWPWRRGHHVGRDKRGEIWLRSTADTIHIDGPLGRFALPVQPSGAARFAGRRVVMTLSKDNAPRWIGDWIDFYAREHAADAVLLYDNGSTTYGPRELAAELTQRFPDLVIEVVSWPFPYGPQGGLAGTVDGVETPWDSDFCQTGALQHARFRFLHRAEAVLNVDIDELVLGDRGRTIFDAVRESPHGFVKFAGRWISSVTPDATDPDTCRHRDFRWRDSQIDEICPPKWCLRPTLARAARDSWSVHNLFGAPANRVISDEFVYRHFRAISNNWKYRRWSDDKFDPARFVPDAAWSAAAERVWPGNG